MSCKRPTQNRSMGVSPMSPTGVPPVSRMGILPMLCFFFGGNGNNKKQHSGGTPMRLMGGTPMLRFQTARKVLVLLVCAAGAAALVSCANMSNPMFAPPSTQPQSPNTHLASSTDPTLETAIAMVMDGKYADASKILEPLIVACETSGDLRQAAESTFWLGYCKEKSGKSAEAAAFYRRVIERYPQTAAARTAQDRLDALGPQP